MITGHQLRQLRKLKDIKQDTIARQLSISQPAYCLIEKRPSINGEELDRYLHTMNYTRERAMEILGLLPPPPAID